jgi:hypothetical protein
LHGGLKQLGRGKIGIIEVGVVGVGLVTGVVVLHELGVGPRFVNELYLLCEIFLDFGILERNGFD